MKCPQCHGEGGRVTWLRELDDEEFVWCRRCGGHGYLTETKPPSLAREFEPYDFQRERIERHDQESLSRLEQP